MGRISRGEIQLVKHCCEKSKPLVGVPLVGACSITMIPEISIEEAIKHYDVFLFDAFGVLVCSGGVFPQAQKCLRTLRDRNVPYFVVTNDASKLPATSAAYYQSYGLPITEEQILTSGMMLKQYFSHHDLIGTRCVVLGTEDSMSYVERAGGKVVSPEEYFDILVIADESGFPFQKTVDTVLTSLFHLLDKKRDIRLILPNPDCIYPKANNAFGFGAGSLAAMFESALRMRYPHKPELAFTPLGKPHKYLFSEALHRSGKNHALMIGDQLETDIRGARSSGIDVAWMCTEEMLEILPYLPDDLRPTYRIHSLSVE